jgi:hypothetical protein
MKLLLVICLAMCSLYAQIEPGQVQVQQLQASIEETFSFGDDNFLLYKVQRVNGTKTLFFDVLNCEKAGLAATVSAGLLSLPFLAACTMVSESTAETLDGTQEVLAEFYNQYPDGQQWYVPLAPPSSPPPAPATVVHPHLVTAQPAAPPNPHLVDFDGLSNNIYDFDLTTYATLSATVIPYSTFATNLAIRPTATGPDNEVWAITPQDIYVVDIGVGTILTTIAIPSSIQNSSNTFPTNRTTGFTSSGATFFYAVPYFTADSAGNKGALLVFDVASRTLTSTVLLKISPDVLVVAPDGLTVYLLSGGAGNITYYDVLSGTADLSVPLYTPGGNPNYFTGYGPVFIHPDGTRLFWLSGGISVFDLTSRQITNTFPVSLPAGVSNVRFQMSQDGSTFGVSYEGNTGPSGTILMALNGNILGSSPSTDTGILTTYIGPGH